MERATVDFGIDLGTTNSCIAVLDGTKPKVLRTNEGAEITPSAVSFNKKGRLHIGEFAKSQVTSEDDIDCENVCLKFKLAMGQPGPFHTFKVTNKQMTPEELSSEVLKKLKGDVFRSLAEELSTATISVPAAFVL